jgi:hypothetical protein
MGRPCRCRCRQHLVAVRPAVRASAGRHSSRAVGRPSTGAGPLAPRRGGAGQSSLDAVGRSASARASGSVPRGRCATGPALTNGRVGRPSASSRCGRPSPPRRQRLGASRLEQLCGLSAGRPDAEARPAVSASASRLKQLFMPSLIGAGARRQADADAPRWAGRQSLGASRLELNA